MKIRKDYYIVPYRHLDIAPEISLTESTILFFFSSLWSEKYNALSNWVSLRSFPLDIERGLWPMIQILTLLLLSHKSLQLIFCVCVCVSNFFIFFWLDTFCCLSSSSLLISLSSFVCCWLHSMNLLFLLLYFWFWNFHFVPYISVSLLKLSVRKFVLSVFIIVHQCFMMLWNPYQVIPKLAAFVGVG